MPKNMAAQTTATRALRRRPPSGVTGSDGPFKDIGARRNIVEKIGSTDHLSFIALGLPGFNTIQDYAEYDTRVHHTNMDFAERVDATGLKQASVVLASFAYRAAMRDGKFPRAAVTP